MNIWVWAGGCAVLYFGLAMLGCRQIGKATGFGPVIRGFESFHPSHNSLKV
ncbi:hypothetical protein DSUL_50105 [Desulfovibrionales bacterium]